MDQFTEAEWLACTGTPARMTRYVRDTHPISQEFQLSRKARLFACAGCRRLESFLRLRRQREVAALAEQARLIGERVAEGLATGAEFAEVRGMIDEWLSRCRTWTAKARHLALSARAVVQPEAWQAAIGVLDAGYGAAWADVEPVPDYLRAKCDLVREVYGNPFQPVPAERAWLSWREGTVVRMAEAIYDEWAFERLPILADALEDAGCDSAEILAHCREPGEHVRGCWVVDLLLAKG
jgi:hypothetical protein